MDTAPNTLERWLTGPRIGTLPSPAALPVPKLSFEFFPPKNDKMEADLWAAIRRLEPLGPRFVSVTYGAGGSTRSRTHDTVARLVRETSLTPAAHLTCVGATREEVDEVARAYWDAGVRHIVALRGDPPAGAAGYEPHPGGYAQAEDLVRGLRRIGDFDISVGAYPETHPAAVCASTDLDFLKRKIDAGANRAITQYFFDTDVYLRFLDRCHAAGITLPIVPGILPVANFTQVKRFSAMCGTSVPAWLEALFEGLEEDTGTRHLIAATVAAEQVRILQANGVDEFHFYTLNRADLTYAIAHILGARPQKGMVSQDAAPQEAG
ncbi:methylenetetrahydrofolate reductase [NAD(P)H] [Sabulicella glaciei]|uniref:Methylenetetrahydrofolate reductase n=1 Tax=Sabulicella glaciei TaxID=2984948 RepID=A0ABT3NVM5_9PROT|nr:methylenetetrahydrofolate reductase [NAD(P)H] [Roseococcus sp. MDT2-1-1]MCW8086223.1 methylenetetrahydrofolate reductase [NAD(P)H] [Roseococcus sp. MDT2-1-1]